MHHCSHYSHCCPYLADLAALGADLGDQHVDLRNEVRLSGVAQLLRVRVCE